MKIWAAWRASSKHRAKKVVGYYLAFEVVTAIAAFAFGPSLTQVGDWVNLRASMLTAWANHTPFASFGVSAALGLVLCFVVAHPIRKVRVGRPVRKVAIVALVITGVALESLMLFFLPSAERLTGALCGTIGASAWWAAILHHAVLLGIGLLNAVSLALMFLMSKLPRPVQA